MCGTGVGASISAANATGKAKYAAAIGPTVTPPPTTIAAVAIGLSFAQSHTSSTGSALDILLKLLAGLLEPLH
jgi:hypothetical protein